MKNSFAKNIAYVGINVALLAISSYLTIPISTPITLQILLVSFICCFFNFNVSFLSVSIYLIAGLMGLPFFSGFRGGISVLFSPTGGFLIGFLFFPIITLLFRKIKNDILKLAFAFTVSLILLYALGIIWFGYNVKNFSLAFKSLLILFPLDLLKCSISIILYKKIKKPLSD